MLNDEVPRPSRRRQFFVLVALLLLCVGCRAEERSREAASPATPEDAYRQFMLALLTGNESLIRGLIVPTDDAEALFQAGYPKEVAAMLADQYRTMEISRVNEDSGDENESVLLASSACPLPLRVRRVAGSWKVDAAPVIEWRQAAEKLRQARPSEDAK